jgi:hypothetical protein
MTENALTTTGGAALVGATESLTERWVARLKLEGTYDVWDPARHAEP